MLAGTSSIAGVRGKAAESEVLLIPNDQLKRALASLPSVGESIVKAFIMRRKRLLRDPDFLGLRIIAVPAAATGHRMHDFLDKNHIPHRLIDLRSETGRHSAQKLELTDRDLPVLIAADGKSFKQPTLIDIARVAGLLRPLSGENDAELFCDLAIIGAGPAGLAAAVYAASEGLKTVVLESFAPGGQAGSSSLIENFFGFPDRHQRRGSDLSRAASGVSFWREILHALAGALAVSFAEGEHGARSTNRGQRHHPAREMCHHFHGRPIQSDRGRRPRDASKVWAYFTPPPRWNRSSATARR